MTNEDLIDLSNELKSDETANPIEVFEEFAKNNNISQDELEQLLSKKYDCFKCESCHKFYCYDEYSYFDEECIYCCNSEDDEQEY
ncbi:MAG: hypothetical protein EOM78_20505 [Erysipelotrichia bacterium]|nr:hypothetical protein [Erysipelotrichia bacterium]